MTTEEDLAYATSLAAWMAKNFYPEVPQWQPLEDMGGVLSQISNMLTGLMRRPA